MAKKNFIDDISVNTIVGPGALITGNVTVSGFLRIDGDIDGNIQTQGRVIIGEEARIRGNIRACRRNCAGGYYCAGLCYHSFFGDGYWIDTDKKATG